MADYTLDDVGSNLSDLVAFFSVPESATDEGRTNEIMEPIFEKYYNVKKHKMMLSEEQLQQFNLVIFALKKFTVIG